MVESAANKGMLWTINDSGHEADIFLIDQKAETRMTCRLEGVDNRDWEDIALAKDPATGTHFVYVGDVGDNMSQYETKIIYRFAEPRLGNDKKIMISRFDRFEVTLPDGRHDIETLMIDPITNDMFMISKWDDSVRVYRVPYPYAFRSTAILELALPLYKIVAGDISVDGTEILLKDYAHVYYWKKDAEESVSNTLKLPPVRVPYLREPQGESIAFARDGSGYYTLSESTNKARASLLFYKRK